MKRALLVLLLLVGSAALAQDARKLPFNPWDKATTGDWETLTVESVFEGKDAAALKGAFTPLQLVTYRVRGADANEVKIAFETIPQVVKEEERIATIFSRTETPSIEKLLDLKGEVRDVKATDVKRTIGGREFACTKITYTSISSRGVKTENAVFFSKDVRTFGLVELVSVVPLGPDTKCTLTYRVAGFGSKDKVEFGKRPDELKK